MDLVWIMYEQAVLSQITAISLGLANVLFFENIFSFSQKPRQDAQTSSASVFHIGISANLNLEHSNPAQVKPKPLKLIPVASYPGACNYYLELLR